MTLYLFEDSDNHCTSHDGHIQIGSFPHSAQEHIRLNPTIDWLITYWCPDIFINRYPSVSFQKTKKKNEGSPKTDNNGQGSEAFESKPRGCNKLEDK